MFSAVNEDFRFARRKNISLKSAGFINAQIRVLTAALAGMSVEEADALTKELPPETCQLIERFKSHPEYKMMIRNAKY